ncbi:hypothetical protein SBA5_30159 [Candidatus Sulfotelmatomonas gaucii]|uniref:Uncharacterized protein n=1 Tax=Candidatus Sulfuritelmatomonas gaucii TaxID=2043161 RepID=A0A2N9LD20_9BACT|nr:hypothetical protein SBA5_30159 [Candidatus Sulfotelmatomonas gaucii]
MHAVFLRGSTDVARRAAERGIVAMAVDVRPEGLLLIPAAFAICFMLWGALALVEGRKAPTLYGRPQSSCAVGSQ